METAPGTVVRGERLQPDPVRTSGVRDRSRTCSHLRTKSSGAFVLRLLPKSSSGSRLQAPPPPHLKLKLTAHRRKTPPAVTSSTASSIPRQPLWRRPLERVLRRRPFQRTSGGFPAFPSGEFTSGSTFPWRQPKVPKFPMQRRPLRNRV